MGDGTEVARADAPEILAVTAAEYRRDALCLNLQDARELQRAADLLDALSIAFRLRADVSDAYRLPRLSRIAPG